MKSGVARRRRAKSTAAPAANVLVVSVGDRRIAIPARRIVEVARLVGRARGAFASHVWRGTAAGNLGGWQVARALQQGGHDVVAVMTRGAQNFVGPLTFEAITRRPVITDQWAPGMRDGRRRDLHR